MAHRAAGWLGQIFVRSVQGPSVALSVAGDATVASLKRTLFHREGVSPHHQVLSAAGRVLQDDAALADYGLADGATVSLLLRLNGAGARFAVCYVVC